MKSTIARYAVTLLSIILLTGCSSVQVESEDLQIESGHAQEPVFRTKLITLEGLSIISDFKGRVLIWGMRSNEGYRQIQIGDVLAEKIFLSLDPWSQVNISSKDG